MNNQTKKHKIDNTNSKTKSITSNLFYILVSYPIEHKDILEPLIHDVLDNETFEKESKDFDTAIKLKLRPSESIEVKDGVVVFECSSFNASPFIQLNLMQAKSKVIDFISKRAPELNDVDIHFKLLQFMFDL